MTYRYGRLMVILSEEKKRKMEEARGKFLCCQHRWRLAGSRRFPPNELLVLPARLVTLLRCASDCGATQQYERP